jgi:hypothetical protein
VDKAVWWKIMCRETGGAGGISLSPIFNGINFIASISLFPISME